MRIERIRSTNIWGVGNVDWIFPPGPVLLIFEGKSYQKLFSDLLLTLFYDQQILPLLTEQSQKALVEVWLSDDSSNYYHICNQFIIEDRKFKRLSTLIDKTGQTICLPDTMTMGEYFFKLQLPAFLQGGIVKWPENDDYESLFQRIDNLCKGGDEGLSLAKVQASIVGAQKRVNEQKESMDLVKVEYDTLRCEWEAAHRNQDDRRLLQIKVKNLQEQEKILTEKIAFSSNLQKRLELLSKNPDYRELRQLQDEIKRLEERLQTLEASLGTSESSVDWIVIEGLREECMEWACLQKNLGHLSAEIQARSKQIVEIQNFLQESGYEGLSENEDHVLKRTENEREATQKRLNRLITAKLRLDKLKDLYIQESAAFHNLTVMADITKVDIIRITQKETRLEMWRDSIVGSTLDQTLRKRFGVTPVAERLSSSLLHYYKRYHVTNYQDFMSQLNKFRNQQKRVDKIVRMMEKLQEKVNQEGELRRIVESCNQILKHAFTKVQAANFLEWLNGWEYYHRKKHQLSLELNELNLNQEQQSIVEKELTACAQILREKLKNWGIPTSGREEALAAVLKVAGLLQERDDAKREFTLFLERFHYLLGNRNMEQLSKTLEPLAELEREILFSDEERLAEIATLYKEQGEIRQHLVDLNQRLQSNHKFPSLSVLEKKIEVVKHRWMTYEDLRNALNDAKDLLELSWQEWQTKHEKTLNQEKQFIYDHCFTPLTLKSLEREIGTKRDYFSYRMAIAQLAFRNNDDLPLFFLVEKLKIEDQNFWEPVIDYLQKMSLSRQVIFCTSDVKLCEMLFGKKWSFQMLKLAP